MYKTSSFWSTGLTWHNTIYFSQSSESVSRNPTVITHFFHKTTLPNGSSPKTRNGQKKREHVSISILVASHTYLFPCQRGDKTISISAHPARLDRWLSPPPRNKIRANKNHATITTRQNGKRFPIQVLCWRRYQQISCLNFSKFHSVLLQIPEISESW